MPNAIGIIMDGNRRWAREKGLPLEMGHQEGARKLKNLISWAKEVGVKEVTVYAFSTENWGRAVEEVSYLMRLFEEMFARELRDIEKQQVRIRFIGQRGRFSAPLQKLMNDTEERTKDHSELTVILAMSYGGRAEILSAAQKLIESGDEVTEDTFTAHLWSAELLEPELIIRTGGEKRLSNFLPWQSVYSELFFVDTLWPDFSKEEFLNVLSEYEHREIRKGK